MGVSADAILFYGYCWNKEHELFLDGVGNAGYWGEVVARKRGHVDPHDAFPKKEFENLPFEVMCKAVENWRKANREAMDSWCKAKSAIEKEFGVEVGQHCSDKCSVPYVAVAASRTTARRGYPVDMSEKGMVTLAEWDGMLDRWFHETGAEKPEGQNVPRWWLVSYWG